MWFALFVGGLDVCGSSGWMFVGLVVESLRGGGGWVWRWLSWGFNEHKIYRARDGHISQYRPRPIIHSSLQPLSPLSPFYSRTHFYSLSFGGFRAAPFAFSQADASKYNTQCLHCPLQPELAGPIAAPQKG
ncbi:hypothetical protein BDQ17DRAFT_169831 [Cyathus striatus]|nr:hypothetical protein BDQ17DRAFT_169831 [Cyathus striatus]